MTYPWEDLENEEYMYRIMIVEDDEVIANAIRQHLVSWGMEAFCVQDFSDVLTEFAATSPQLVLMDIHLPFLTVTTGARRSGTCRRFRYFSFLPLPTI